MKALALTKERIGATLLVVIALAIPASAGLVACSASKRTSTLDGVYAATLAAGSAFEAYDASHQQSIVAAGLEKPTVDTQLATWRGEQVKVLQAFVLVYQAIDAAQKANTDATVAGAIAAAAALTAELKKDGVL